MASASSVWWRCTGVDPETLTIAGQSLVVFQDATFLLGPGFCAGIGNGLLLGFIMLRSGLMPRRPAASGWSPAASP